MEKMIEAYETLYRVIAERIQTLENRLSTEILRTKQKEKLMARIECLKEERFELVDVIHELRQHR